MTRRRSGFRRITAAGLLAAYLASAAAISAEPAPAPPSQEELAAMAKQIDTVLTRSFELPPALQLDPQLRMQAESLRDAHLERMRKLLPIWLHDELDRQTADKVRVRYSVFYAVWAQVLNELALWQVEPGDAAYEQATLAVLKTAPGACHPEGDTRYLDFASRVMRLQAMAPAQRQAALATERELLAHWGQPRVGLPEWPDPLPQEAGMAQVVRMRAEGPTPQMALSPVLASDLLAKRNDYRDLPWETKCLFQQWWLRASLAQGTAPAAALNAFRYGTMISAMDRLGAGFEQERTEAAAKAAAEAAAKGVPAYPRLASAFDVEGKTTVRRRLDAAGKPVQASVAKRDITVRGIRGVRPVAFESTFDALSMKYGLTAQVTAKPAADNTQLFQMVWMLDPTEPATQAVDKPKRGAQ